MAQPARPRGALRELAAACCSVYPHRPRHLCRPRPVQHRPLALAPSHSRANRALPAVRLRSPCCPPHLPSLPHSRCGLVSPEPRTRTRRTSCQEQNFKKNILTNYDVWRRVPILRCARRRGGRLAAGPPGSVPRCARSLSVQVVSSSFSSSPTPVSVPGAWPPVRVVSTCLGLGINQNPLYICMRVCVCVCVCVCLCVFVCVCVC